MNTLSRHDVVRELDSGVIVRDVRGVGKDHDAPLVLHPGIGGTVHDFDRLIPHLDAERIIVVDTARAHALGKFATHHSPDAPWRNPLQFTTIDTYVELYDDTVRELIGDDTFRTIDYSWAGVRGLAYELTHPGRVERATYVATVPIIPAELPTPTAVYAVNQPDRSASWLLQHGPAMYGGVDQDGRDIARHPESLLSTSAQRAIDPEAYAHQQDIAYTPLAQLRLGMLAAQLHLIQTPSLVLAGERDPLVPPANAHSLHARLARSALRLHPDAGHLLLEFQAPFSAQTINAFHAGAFDSEIQTHRIRHSLVLAA